MFENGHIGPIRPVKIYDAGDIQLALRQLQQLDHIGKVVVKFPQDSFSIPHLTLAPALSFDPKSSYLLVGGLGGLGRVIAKWMARNGARHLIFLSRSGLDRPRQQKCVAELEHFGCSITVVKRSVEVPADVAKAISESERPIRGVIHLAMLLKDTSILDMTIEDWEQARGPKVTGAWIFNDAFSSIGSLDFFILSSSMNTVAAMPGQGNYCAANTSLEGLCQYRRSLGLAATVLSICAIEYEGFISENKQAERNVRSRGAYFLSHAELLDYLELAILCSDPNRSSDVKSNARPWERTGPIILGLRSDKPLNQQDNQASWRRDRRMGFYHNTNTDIRSRASSVSNDRLQYFLHACWKDPELLFQESSVEILAEEIGSQIFAFLLKPTEERIDIELSIAEIGLDSLVSIELRRWWKQSFALENSTLEIMASGTLRGLGELAAKGLQERLMPTL